MLTPERNLGGRPTKSPTGKTRRLTITLTPEADDALKAEAERTRAKVSDIIDRYALTLKRN